MRLVQMKALVDQLNPRQMSDKLQLVAVWPASRLEEMEGPS
jgi:hypothetical protein